LTKLELAEELFQAGGLLVHDKSSKALKERDLTQVVSVLTELMRKECRPHISFEDFFRNPRMAMKEGKLRQLRYDEYCASVKQSLITDGGVGAAPDSFEASKDILRGQTSAVARRPLPWLRLQRVGNGDLKYTYDKAPMESAQQGSTQLDYDDASPPSSWSFAETTNISSPSLPDEDEQCLYTEPQEKQQMEIETNLSGVESEAEQSTEREVKQVENEARQQTDNQVENQIITDAGPVLRLNSILRSATDYHLDTGLLSESFQRMFSQSKSRIHQSFAACGVPEGKSASFMLYPQANLQQLYGMVTGSGRMGYNPKAAIVSDVSAEELALSLFGAFLVRVVFGGSLGETFDEFQAKVKLSEAETELQQVLQEEFRTYFCPSK
jgi:hypothetical protein